MDNQGVELLATTSLFLKLPPELRNSIYEIVAIGIDTISIRDSRLLYAPPLSLACHQTRKEFEAMYRQEAAKYATKTEIHLTNFVHKQSGEAILPIADFLPAAALGVERHYTLRIFLTNTFDSYLQYSRSLVSMARREATHASPGYDVEIDYNPRTFDVEYCRQLLTKLRWCHANPEAHRKGWERIEKGFEAAFARYAPEKQPPRRKRKHPKASQTAKTRSVKRRRR